MSHSYKEGGITGLILGLTLALVVAGSPAGAIDEGVPCSPEPTDMTIAYGQIVTCDIGIDGDSDIFRFAGATGEVVVLQISEISGSFFDPCIEFYDPFGALLDSVCGSANARIDFTLSDDGTHTVLASEQNSTETGSYSLALERIAPKSPAAVPIGFGEVTDAEMINPDGDLDVFTFEGNDGDLIAIEMSEVSGSFFDPCIELFDPSGTELSFDCSSSSARIDISLGEPGTYKVLATEQNDTETGEYTLSLQCIVGPCTLPTRSLTIFPSSGAIALTSRFDLTFVVEAPGLSVTMLSVLFDGVDVSGPVANCSIVGVLVEGGETYRCRGLDGDLFGVGVHTMNVTATLSDGTTVGDLVTWEVFENLESPGP